MTVVNTKIEMRVCACVSNLGYCALLQPISKFIQSRLIEKRLDVVFTTQAIECGSGRPERPAEVVF